MTSLSAMSATLLDRAARIPSRWLVAGPALVAFAVAAWSAVRVVQGVRGNPLAMVDLSVYRAGGRAALDGRDLYTMRESRTGLPFTYPPFAALAFVPLAAIGAGLGQLVFSLVSLLALVRVAWLVARSGLGRVVSPAGVFAAAACLLAVGLRLEPVSETFSFGQINLVLLWLIVEDLLGAVPPRLRGVLIGVAAGLKLTPALFAVYLLVVGRPRDAARAVAGFVGTVALGFALLPGESWRYWTGIAYDAKRVGGIAYAGNQSINAVLIRLSSVDGARVAWLLSAVVVTGVALLTARALSRTGRELFAVSVVGVASLLVSPVAWNHHWVWAVPVLGALLAELARGGKAVRPAALLLVAVVAVFTSRVIWRVPARDDREYGWHGWQVLAGNGYVLCGLVVVAYAAWTVRSEFWPGRPVR
jgi:alpha-1,2-mannosyltransferase